MSKEYWKSIPHLSVLVLILGIIKQVLFYTNFDIPIKYFLSLAEIGIIISDELLAIITIIFCYSILGFWSTENQRKEMEKDKAKQHKEKVLPLAISEEDLKEIKEVEKKLNPPVGKIVVGILMGIFLISSYFLKHYSDKLIILSFVVFIGGLACFTFIVNYAKLKIGKSDTIAFIFILCILTASIFLTGSQINIIERGKYKGTKIFTKDSIYVSDDNNYFIGKTGEYIFIHNHDSTNTILPLSSVDKIQLKINSK